MTLSLLSMSSLNATQDLLWSVVCPGREAAERPRVRLEKGEAKAYYKTLDSITSTLGLSVLTPLTLSVWASDQITHFPYLQALGSWLDPWEGRLAFFYLSTSIVFILTRIFFAKINNRLFFETHTETSKEIMFVKKNLPAWKASALSLITLGYPILALEESFPVNGYPREIATCGGLLWMWHIGLAGFTICKAAFIWSIYSPIFAEYFLISSFLLITNCIVYPTIWHNLLSLKYRDCHLVAAVSHFVYHVLAAVVQWRIDALNDFAPLLLVPPTAKHFIEMFLSINCAFHIAAALECIGLHRWHLKKEELQIEKLQKIEEEDGSGMSLAPTVHTI